ncbi:hypothetical protein MRB53_026122 [Persea americana]|uniref:Uncharacterized protein n=1 Tax=Persea americana TaxID=3435 RepID=A0ACC2LH55_PERAE|nr:hypothetical protein MRB53_026122 [Persea americana]
MEAYISGHIPNLAQLRDMPAAFIQMYCRIAAHKFFFFCDPHRRGKACIKKVLLSNCLEELMELYQVQKKLQMRIKAQGKYLQAILEKAQKSLSSDGLNSGLAQFGKSEAMDTIVYQGAERVQELLHMERSCDWAIRKNKLKEKFRKSRIRKIFNFRVAINTAFEDFHAEYLSSSESDENKGPKRVKKPAVKSPAKREGKEPKLMKDDAVSVIRGFEPTTTCEDQDPNLPHFESPNLHHFESPNLPSSVERHTTPPVGASDEHTVVDILSMPQQPSTSQAIIVSPARASINSLIWRIK